MNLPPENPPHEDDVEDIEVKAEGATLEAKDMFSHRPLPFIIGTDPFNEDEYVGLMEEEEEEEEIIEEQPEPSSGEGAAVIPDAPAAPMIQRDGGASDFSSDEEDDHGFSSDEEDKSARKKRVGLPLFLLILILKLTHLGLFVASPND